MALSIISFLLGLSLMAQMALACQYSPPRGFKNRATLQAQDCSFRWAGPVDELKGGAVRGLEGRVFQVIHFFENRSLMAVDCKARKAIVVHGSPVPGAGVPGCFEVTDIGRDLPPNGQLQLAGHATLDDFASSARALGLRVSDVSAGYNTSFEPMDRFDVFCGCNLEFPDADGEDK